MLYMRRPRVRPVQDEVDVPRPPPPVRRPRRAVNLEGEEGGELRGPSRRARHVGEG